MVITSQAECLAQKPGIHGSIFTVISLSFGNPASDRKKVRTSSFLSCLKTADFSTIIKSRGSPCSPYTHGPLLPVTGFSFCSMISILAAPPFREDGREYVMGTNLS